MTPIDRSMKPACARDRGVVTGERVPRVLFHAPLFDTDDRLAEGLVDGSSSVKLHVVKYVVETPRGRGAATDRWARRRDATTSRRDGVDGWNAMGRSIDHFKSTSNGPCGSASGMISYRHTTAGPYEAKTRRAWSTGAAACTTPVTRRGLSSAMSSAVRVS